jgi:hypothetical protein
MKLFLLRSQDRRARFRQNDMSLRGGRQTFSPHAGGSLGTEFAIGVTRAPATIERPATAGHGPTVGIPRTATEIEDDRRFHDSRDPGAVAAGGAFIRFHVVANEISMSASRCRRSALAAWRAKDRRPGQRATKIVQSSQDSDTPRKSADPRAFIMARETISCLALSRMNRRVRPRHTGARGFPGSRFSLKFNGKQHRPDIGQARAEFPCSHEFRTGDACRTDARARGDRRCVHPVTK